jgi:transcriptional regulator with XRE-family HTH domain
MKILKLHRNKRHLSLSEMGEKFGITKSHLWYCENGKRSPSMQLLKRMSKVTQIPLVKLIAAISVDIER